MTTYAPEIGSVAAPKVHVTGRRVLATIVDALVLGLINLVLAVPAGLMGGNETAAAGLSLIATLAALLVWVLYYILMEGYLGQTVGKIVCGIKVVREDGGEVPGLGKAAIRTVLRMVDGFLAYLIAFVAVLASERCQRLGDMAAGTLVVRK